MNKVEEEVSACSTPKGSTAGVVEVEPSTPGQTIGEDGNEGEDGQVSEEDSVGEGLLKLRQNLGTLTPSSQNKHLLNNLWELIVEAANKMKRYIK